MKIAKIAPLLEQAPCDKGKAPWKYSKYIWRWNNLTKFSKIARNVNQFALGLGWE